jgi:hypothetical protein
MQWVRAPRHEQGVISIDKNAVNVRDAASCH